MSLESTKIPVKPMQTIWESQGLLRYHASRSGLHGLEMRLVKKNKVIQEFQPQTLVIDSVPNLSLLGNPTEINNMFDSQSPRHLLLSGIAVVLEEQGSKGASIQMVNCSEQRMAQLEVRRSQEQLHLVLNHIHEGVIVRDSNRRVVFSNEMAAKQLGYNSVEELNLALPENVWNNVETYVVISKADRTTLPELSPGRYIMLKVADTGHGIDTANLKKIFEPFFTTKEKNKNSGLGLATAYGIIKQTGGEIVLESEKNKGTSFQVYLPALDPDDSNNLFKTGAAKMPELTRGDETILVAEDEETVRNLVVKLLVGQGYTVISAKNGKEALEVAEAHNSPIQLLLSDVVMPVLNGRELAGKLVLQRPDIKVLFMSGYTDDTIVQKGIENSRSEFIGKPFSPSALLQKVRDVLSSPINAIA